MKTLLRSLFALFLLAGIAASAHGRPWWKEIDADTKDAPSRYGYNLQRADRDGVSHFALTVDPVAAKVLVQARIVGGAEGVSEIPILRKGGFANLEFSIPTASLLESVLRLDSAEIKHCGPHHQANFQGYSIRLDNISTETGVGLPFETSASIDRGAAVFTLKFDDAFWISGPSPKMLPRLLSLSLESSGSNQLIVPLPIVATDMVNRETKFSIPIEQLPDVVLVAKITDQADFVGAKARISIVGLGIIATKAEQDGADQPATAPESKPEGGSKPQPESEVRSQ